MRMRLPSRALITLGCICLSCALAHAAPKGDDEFRAAWLAFAAPAADPKQAGSQEARQQARLAAVSSMEAAVAADSRNAAYLGSLAYICLAAGRYEDARSAVDRAIALRRDLPLLYLLRGQAEAALAQMDPPQAGERIGPALTAFDRAAELDPTNALALIQGASVAIDAGRPDEALVRLRRALERPAFQLYRLWVPSDLSTDAASSLRIWQYIQLGQWSEVVARCQNLASFAMKLGMEEERKGNLEAASECFRWALEVGRMTGGSEPPLFITLAPALNMMEDAYRGLARAAAESALRNQFPKLGAPEPKQQDGKPDYREMAKLLIRSEFRKQKYTREREKAAYQKWTGMEPPPADLDDPRWAVEVLTLFHVRLAADGGTPRTSEGSSLERWLGEAGVVSFARSQLLTALNLYLKEVADSPPSVEGALAAEAKQLAPVIAGVGIRALPPRQAEPVSAPTKRGNSRSG